MQTSDGRYRLIDSIRGIAVVNMVVYHFLYDILVVYGGDAAWHYLPPVFAWRLTICSSFIFISGFVWNWGKESCLCRGLLFNIYGLLISFITLTALPSQTIWFGILNFIGCAILIMLPLHPAAQKIPPLPGMAGSLLLFLLSWRIPEGYLAAGTRLRISLPSFLYSIKILTPLGFPFQGFYSSDYFPIFPWFFLYLSGYYFNGIFAMHPSWQSAARIKLPFLCGIGQKSVWIYLLHQPILYLICSFIF